jgi:hypothetical protein
LAAVSIASTEGDREFVTYLQSLHA